MPRRFRRWIIVAALSAAVVAALAAAHAPYLPLVHGSTADEIERMAAWLELRPGMQVADFGAGDGTFAVALARRVGASGLVYATEIDPELLAEIRHAANGAGLVNVKVVAGAAADAKLPERCCDAIFSRVVYHHLARPEEINAGLFRALRPGGRLLVIDFEPGGLMDWFEGAGRHGGHGTPKGALVKEVSAAGFEVVRGPEPWRGRLYGVLFRRP
jgi:ubiquinone/menaquinone biosynthesis C-methylase UbiE